MDPPLVTNDDYYWLRDDARNATDVLAHLAAENAYANCSAAGEEALAGTVFEELVSYVQQADASVPQRQGGFVYYSRTVEGVAYPLHARRRILGRDVNGSVGGVAVPDDGQVKWAPEELGPEEVVLNVSALAGDAPNFEARLGGVSPDHTLVAYAVDTTGAEVYEGRVRVIATGEERPADVVPRMGTTLAWGRDSRTLFYTTADATQRAHKVWRRTLSERPGGGPAVDELLLTEADPEYYADFGVTRSGRFLTLTSASADTSEVSLLDLDADAAARAAGAPPPRPTLLAPRAQKVLYTVAHTGGEDLVVVTNAGGAANFKLSATTVGAAGGAANWTDVAPYNATVAYSSVTPYERFAVLSYRRGGYTRLAVVAYAGGGGGGGSRALNLSSAVEVTFPEEAATVTVVGGTYESRAFLFRYQSMTTPAETWAYDGVTHARTLLKAQPVPVYNRSLYTSERWEVAAADGVTIPLSVVYRTDRRAAAGTPQAVHLYGYGSYGLSVNPRFIFQRLPLLDRGVVFAVAHVRGGGAMGHSWYEAARLDTKNVTFTDFISVGRALVDRNITTPAQLSMEGASAGGLLIGAVLTMAPDLAAAGALLGVPFVDVLTTMADPSIPLTTGEWREWGNPNTRAGYDTIAAYSPVENVRRGAAYPPVLLTTGLYDPRVGYWEAAKMAARLRAAAPAGGRGGKGVALRVDLVGGHFFPSDRFRSWRQRAAEIAWLLTRHGIRE